MPSLLEAIESKYSESEEIGPSDGSFVIFAPKVSARDAIPCILVLDNCNVDSAGDEERLVKLCSNVEELDLSHNKLTEWNEIAKILRQTPSAKFVNLSFNNLSTPLEKCVLPSMQNLQSLVLIGTNVTWNTVWNILNSITNLEELHLSKNNFECIELPEKKIDFSLSKLTFDGNPVSNWAEISKLDLAFPNLNQLSLSNCPITSMGDEAFDTIKFCKLEILNISNTLLQTRDEISKLNRFPLLSEIRASGIPFLNEMPDKERRQELVALLPKICKLNGGAKITDEERDAAERYFIRKYLQENEKPTRYVELIDKHGSLDPLVEIELKPITEVTLKIMFGKLEVEKKINLYQSVRSFKKFLEPIVGIEPARMILYYNGIENNFGMDVLRFPDKQLYTYKMHDGDEIHVELKNKTGHEITN